MKKHEKIEKENENLKALEESDDPPQSEIGKSKAKIRVLQIEKESLKAEYNLTDLRKSRARRKKRLRKQQAQVRGFASDFTKVRGDYNKRIILLTSLSQIQEKNLKKFQMMKSQKNLMRDNESNQSLNKMRL